MAERPEEIAKQIIASNSYLTIATATNEGNPWITPVFYACDTNYHFYWYSRKETKHTTLIRENNRVALVIFNPNASDVEAKGVYIQAIAAEVPEDQLPLVLPVYFRKAQREDTQERRLLIAQTKDFTGESPLRMYRAIPQKVYLSGKSKKWRGKWLDSRIEVPFHA
jgi:uncharacterized protein YhbP (UPF0306 family)